MASTKSNKTRKEKTLEKDCFFLLYQTRNDAFNGQQMPASDYWYSIQLEEGRVVKGHFSLKNNHSFLFHNSISEILTKDTV